MMHRIHGHLLTRIINNSIGEPSVMTGLMRGGYHQISRLTQWTTSPCLRQPAVNRVVIMILLDKFRINLTPQNGIV